MPTLHDPSLLTHAYTELPTLSKWKKDSYVGDYRGPARSKDPALVRIDQLVGEANDAEEWGEKAFALGELFFATMGWLNHYKADDRMDPRRRPWILKLNLCVGNKLAALYEVRLIELAGTLREL